MKRTGTSEKIIIRRDLTKRNPREVQDAKELPLIARTVKPFRLALNRDILNLPSDVAQKQGTLNALRISPDFLESHKRLMQKTEAYFSSIMDTEEIPQDEAFHALDGKQTAFDNPAMQRIFNNRLVLEKIYLLAAKPGTKFTKNLIFELESILQTGRTDGKKDASRDYRGGEVYIADGTDQVVYQGPPPEQVKAMMPAFLEWMNARPQHHPLIDAALGQLYFLHIHPLSDFNGCVARALTLLYLMKNGFDCVRLFSISEAVFNGRAAYYQAIQAAESEYLDATVFVTYFLEAVLRQITSAIDELTKGPLNVSCLSDLLDKQTRTCLNRRQTVALRWLIKNDQRLSTRIYCKLNKCADETARKDFKLLEELDIIQSVGAGRSVEYELKPGEIAP
jgi:Fic family protein